IGASCPSLTVAHSDGCTVQYRGRQLETLIMAKAFRLGRRARTPQVLPNPPSRPSVTQASDTDLFPAPRPPHVRQTDILNPKCQKSTLPLSVNMLSRITVGHLKTK